MLEGLDAVEAELREIDENLIRADLGDAEQAAHTVRRKQLYELKHPETKKGAAGRGRKKSRIATSNKPAPAFIDDTAQKAGKHRSTVARAVRRGNSIPDVADLAGTSLDQGDELDATAKLGEDAPDRQAEVIERAKKGEKVSAKSELKRARRAKREAELAAKQTALPDKRYGVILADPEWQLEFWSEKGKTNSSAENHYPTSQRGRRAFRQARLAIRPDRSLFSNPPED